MNLYRIISNDEWTETKANGKVPRCASDKRAGFIHLNKFDDIENVANKYFVKDEKPIVLEIDITKYLSEKLLWELPTKEKNWEQAHLKIDNIEIKFIKRYSYLISNSQKNNEFKIEGFKELHI